MSLALGKRKRAVTSKSTLPSKKATIAKAAAAAAPPPAPEPESDAEDREALNDAFRRAFEKRFKAIEEDKPAEVEVEEEDEEEDDEEAWDGLSEEEEDDEDEVEVVEHNMSNFSRERADKAALKAFMSSKPPTSSDTPNTSKQPTNKKDEDGEGDTEQDDLKNDLALQRLLKESHLLDASSLSTDPSGKNRHKATDLRLLELGSKTSIFTQKNMPIHHRVGIQKKKENKEIERRREAKENGIILERVRKEGTDGRGGGFGGGNKRERGIGNPSVGRFSGGTLKLSKRDVEGITGPKSSGRGGRGGKGGRGRGGGRGGRGGRR